MIPEPEDVNEIDLGRIDFGRFNGTSWNCLPVNYLYYLTTEECKTSDENKRKAKIALWQVQQKKIEQDKSQLNLFGE